MITRIMAGNTEYCISSQSSCDDAITASRVAATSSSSSSTLSTSVNRSTLCNCHQRAADTTTNCSSSSSSARRRISSSNNNSSRMPITSPVFLITIMLVFISYFTCCVSAWPILNQRRTYAYNPEEPQVPDYNELVDNAQWVFAQQPDNYYDVQPSLRLQQQPIYQDMYDEPIYDQASADDDAYSGIREANSYFGPIVDTKQPDEEFQLEELKHEQPYVYEKRRQATKGTATVNTPLAAAASPSPTAASSASHPQTTLIPSDSSPSSSSKVVAFTVSPNRKTINNGQKEIAMLRPASSKSHFIQLDEPEEPQISVAQRSPSNEKPSAYDRLRKYLSLDDALKKEYQQRRSNAVNRHHAKRESISSIITDSDSLTGQLNNLKKKLD